MRLALILCSALSLPALHAQRTLVLSAEGDTRMVLVRGHADEADASPVFQATWRFGGEGTEPVMSFQRTAMTDGGEDLALDRLVLAGIEAFLDAHVHFEKQGVRSDLPVRALVARIDGMVAAAVEELGADAGPVRLSEPTVRQLDRLCRIDWTGARFGIDGGAEQDKYLAIYYYVRSQRIELERQLRADLLPLAQVPVHRPTPLPPGRSLQVNSLCGTVFDEENYLCALDLGVTDTVPMTEDVVLDAGALASLSRPRPLPAADAMPAQRVRKRDRWLKAELDRLNQRIDQADQRRELWALRDRLDDLEGRMDDISLELQDIRTSGGEGDADAASHEAPAVVLFASGSVTIGGDQLVTLNEVFDQLVRDPRQRVLVTGHSDASGDEAANLRLSEQRALAVRDHLVRRGIAADRIVVNFLGPLRAVNRDATDRRVEVERLKD